MLKGGIIHPLATQSYSIRFDGMIVIIIIIMMMKYFKIF